MEAKDSRPVEEPDWKVIEETLLERVRGVASRIVERVRRATRGTASEHWPDPNEPTGEIPAT